jgi:hypothetical protein
VVECFRHDDLNGKWNLLVANTGWGDNGEVRCEDEDDPESVLEVVDGLIEGLLKARELLIGGLTESRRLKIIADAPPGLFKQPGGDS